jgi:hypothetical protein
VPDKVTSENYYNSSDAHGGYYNPPGGNAYTGGSYIGGSSDDSVLRST